MTQRAVASTLTLMVAQPGSRLVLAAYGKTDVGRKRDHNEDRVLLTDGLGLFAVADGMGGHDAGDVASLIAAGALEEFFHATKEFPEEDLEAPADLPTGARRLFSAVLHANREVYAKSGKSANQGGMGSTVVAIYVSEREQLVHICHVGDSRCYRLRSGQLEQLTRDHSMINEALRLNPDLSPEILRQLPTNVVTRALGTKESVQPDVSSEPLRAGDVYLLCSDGLSGEITDEEIQFALEDETDLTEASDLLVAMANDAGGRDNISALLVRIEAPVDIPAGEPPRPRTEMESSPLDLNRIIDGAAGSAWDSEEVPLSEPSPEALDDEALELIQEDADELLLSDDELEEIPAPSVSSPAATRSDAELRLDAAVDAALAEVDVDLAQIDPTDLPFPELEQERGEPVVVGAALARKLKDFQADVTGPVVTQAIIAVGVASPEPTPVESGPHCRECGHLLKASARYCGMCGSKVAYVPDPDIARCEQCDAELLVGTKFCVMCGNGHAYADFYD